MIPNLFFYFLTLCALKSSFNEFILIFPNPLRLLYHEKYTSISMLKNCFGLEVFQKNTRGTLFDKTSSVNDRNDKTNSLISGPCMTSFILDGLVETS